MKQTKNTPVVRELVRLGVKRANAYRIVNSSKGVAALLLVRVIKYLLDEGVKMPK